ncbi:hypothetical protein T492DRAFT_900401 [Pavlovales sp. CCMP2436]|nr:hypothetical protein T492DRAFT_900401 [Pavlovales sp. CCMP2436]
MPDLRADSPDSIGLGVVAEEPPPAVCVGCELDRVFNQIWSGGRSAFNPHELLCCAQLAAYKQQDAHEFYVALFQQLHHHTRWRGERLCKRK